MILATGATGFIGAEILRRASARGWRIRGLARHPHRAEALARLPNVELFRGDVNEPDELDEAMEGVTAIVHLVGIILETGKQSFHRVHVEGTRNVLAAAARSKVGRIVHMSALGVETGRETSLYFRTKSEAEQAVRSSGLTATIFRPSLVFGPDDQFFNRLATAIRWSPLVPLPGGGKTRFQPVWVGDVAECFLQATRMDATPEPVYDLAGPVVLSLREIVSVLAGILGKRRATLPLPIPLLDVGAALVERVLPAPPLTRDQLKMLAVDNVSNPRSVRALKRDFEIEHAALREKASQWL
ncbi:MAG TPA: complex I NDUFA9 subunit family protein [Gemmatimonadota bacterium]|nr:complex I NDUFA9 subunit family protein [Gemmatimonadota bacterium]